MVKRGFFASNPPRLRISKPGIDVDSAGPHDFLLHESYLYSQPYFFGWVACPFAGSSIKDEQIATVQVTVPDVTNDPTMIVYAQSSDWRNTYPGQRTEGDGSNEWGWAVENWWVGARVVSSTRVDVTFQKNLNAILAPRGAYLILMRRST